ncbi:MAG: hypothetical protein MK132_14490, partial [Lentisphaerales bacterium]|nr:hypothetical protein [Lentisphaerales bacterium]
MKIIFILPGELSRCQGRSLDAYCQFLKVHHEILVLYKAGKEDDDFQVPGYKHLPLSWNNEGLDQTLLQDVKKFNPAVIHIWNPWRNMLIAGLDCLSACPKAKFFIHIEDDLAYHSRQKNAPE